jgi:hypothetical protein
MNTIYTLLHMMCCVCHNFNYLNDTGTKLDPYLLMHANLKNSLKGIKIK